MSMMNTLGIRRKNPFNIKKSSSNNWIGKINDPYDDSPFESFTKMMFGIRAGMVLLRTYIQDYHLTTPRQIITRFAPAEENNLVNYIFFITLYVDPDQEIKFRDKNFVELCRGMMAFESDYHCSSNYIYQLLNLFRL